MDCCELTRNELDTMVLEQIMAGIDGAGHDEESKTFCPLHKGYNHGASGRVDKIEIRSQNDCILLLCTMYSQPIDEARKLQNLPFFTLWTRLLRGNNNSFMLACCRVSPPQFLLSSLPFT